MNSIWRGGAVLAFAFLTACGGGSLGDGSDGGSLGGSTGGGSGSTSYRVGDASSGSFHSGTIAIDSDTLAAGGSTGMSVDLVGEDGELAPGSGATIAFSSNCLASNKSTITPSPASLDTGRANVTYTATGCSGSDVVTAIVTVDGTTLTAKGTVTIEPPELGGLEFVSATPAVIGMTGSAISSQSVVVFKLTDSAGAALTGRTVNFSLSTSVGGVKLTASSAISDSSGTVRTIVQAGSVHTAVRVKAETTNPSNGLTISSQSEQLAITTGLPDQDSFSLSANKLSVEGSCDGEPVTLNIRAADRYNNPVPQGTAITFTTEGGKINGQCTTGDPLGSPTTEAGTCSVLLNVQNPRPADGLVTVLATAIGEESFTDANGDGFYDAGDGFPAANDLPEAFLDANYNQKRDSSEPFIDFNSNAAFDGPNGKFDGYICDAPGENCSSAKINVRDDIEIVFADTRDAPIVNGFPASISINAGSTAVISGTITDARGNSLPTGTTYSLSTTLGSVVAPTSVGPYSSTKGDPYGFTIEAGDTAGEGTLTLSASIPASACYESLTYSLQGKIQVVASP